MPLTFRYALVCDEVRVENNGKFIIIGLYTPNVLIPQLPFTFPALTFFQAYDIDRPGRFQFRARLQHLESGRELAQAMGAVEIPQPGLAPIALRFGNLRVEQVGTYNFIVNINGQPEPIISAFDIILQPAPAGRQ